MLIMNQEGMRNLLSPASSSLGADASVACRPPFGRHAAADNRLEAARAGVELLAAASRPCSPDWELSGARHQSR